MVRHVSGARTGAALTPVASGTPDARTATAMTRPKTARLTDLALLAEFVVDIRGSSQRAGTVPVTVGSPL
jgi:hypothetical protein